MSKWAGKVSDLRGVLMVGCSTIPRGFSDHNSSISFRQLDGYDKACIMYDGSEFI